MLLKAVGAVMMVDGVLFAMAALPVLNTFVYRSLRDQSLVVAHFLVGVLLVTSGRMLLTGKITSGVVSGKRHPTSFFIASTLVAALIVAAIESTRFDWLWLAGRALYTALALAVVLRITLPKT
jgi:hypothetical protein